MFNPQLATFVCVADCGSFSQAAEKLYLSSTAVMKQLNALERHLELKLLERTRRGTVLTPAGEVIYRYARQMFADSDRALREARAAAQAARSAFCVGTSILNPCRPFMDLWYRFCGHFPGYQLHLVPYEDDHQGILGEIGALGEKFDFLIGACDSRQWLDRCNFLPLGEYRHCIAVPRGHPLAGRKGLTLAELHGETLMMVKQGDSPSVDRVRAAVEAHPQIHIEDTPQFYDMEVFNRSVQTGHLLMSLDPSGGLELHHPVRPALSAPARRRCGPVCGPSPGGRPRIRRQRARRISGGRAVWPEGGHGLRLIVRCGKGG